MSISGPMEALMLDVVYLIGGVAFFAAAGAYVAFCDRVIGVAGSDRGDSGNGTRGTT
jgi:hypothetical protein